MGRTLTTTPPVPVHPSHRPTVDVGMFDAYISYTYCRSCGCSLYANGGSEGDASRTGSRQCEATGHWLD